MAKAKQGQMTELLIERWTQSSKKLEQIAEAIPADKFDRRPAEGVRACSDVLRYVTFWNQYLEAAVRGQDFDDSLNAISTALRERKTSLGSKDILLALTFLEHSAEHYGQLAIYCRLPRIVPPASHA